MSNQDSTDTYQLGTPVTKYDPDGSNIVGGTLMIVMVVVVVVMPYFTLRDFSIFDMIRADPTFGCGQGLVVIGFLLWVFLYGVRIIIRTLDTGKVLVFSDGLVYIKGGQSEVWRWDDITDVWHEVKEKNSEGVYYEHFYTIRRAGGQKRVFDHYLANYMSLGNTIQQEVAKRGGAVWPSQRVP